MADQDPKAQHTGHAAESPPLKWSWPVDRASRDPCHDEESSGHVHRVDSHLWIPPPAQEDIVTQKRDLSQALVPQESLSNGHERHDAVPYRHAARGGV